jgi:hypothetical protein
MFKIAKNSETYTWPVEVQVPTNGGRFTTATFDAIFKVIPQSEIDAAIEAAQEGGNTDAALLGKVWLGWSGVLDEDDQPLGYSEDAKRALLDIPYVRIAVTRAYFASIRGKERQRKN